MSESHKRKRSESQENDTKDEEICTLHLTGFPSSMLPRELKNFCRFLPEFTACSMVNGSSKTFYRPVGFVRFDTAEGAENAIQVLNNSVFDEDDAETVIRAHLANRNLVPRQRRDRGSSNQGRNAYPPYQNQYSMPPYNAPFGGNAPHFGGMYGGPSQFGGGGVIEAKPDGKVMDTLCVRNIGVRATKQDLEDFFGRIPGFSFISFLRARHGSNSALAFVRFDDTNASMQAVSSIQGQVISNCDGAVLVEYARRSLTEDKPERN